eukprot:GFYU01010691.1.p1 GENE.GFYU01010691.1~~GFYU01010691.1.p1  ORF type:complete len:133 (-),score=31.10 GFYU01010691.1:213-566(-)
MSMLKGALGNVPRIIELASQKSAAASKCGELAQCACADFRQQIWVNRIAYWQTRSNTFGAQWKRAQGEWAELTNKLQNPKHLGPAEIGGLALMAAEGVGFFFVGEIIGRGSLIGYKV